MRTGFRSHPCQEETVQKHRAVFQNVQKYLDIFSPRVNGLAI